MSKPLIGMSGRRWPASALADNVPKAMYELKFDLHFSDYPASVAAAGGLPVELTRDADVVGVPRSSRRADPERGSDVEPDRYGHHADENLGAIEPDRDEWELALFREARRLEMPILAICRGAQLANVYYGGTLNQHIELDDGAGHPQWDTDGRERTHEVNVVPGSLLSSLYPASIGVNSLHHQTLAVLGNDLVVSATAPDGVVEAWNFPVMTCSPCSGTPNSLKSPTRRFDGS